jgi:pyridoxine/pyridoxamine 5'-phosphate oxidase
VEIEELWRAAWEGVDRALSDRRAPFRTFTFATAEPDARIVVLRGAVAGEWVQCHTDARSTKAAALAANPACAALFYDPQARLQLRLRGRAELHRSDAVARQAWEAADLLARRCYVGAASGSPIDSPEAWIDPSLASREPAAEESEPGFKNLLVIRLHVESAEALQLAFTAHRRAAFRRTAEGWKGAWLAP